MAFPHPVSVPGDVLGDKLELQCAEEMAEVQNGGPREGHGEDTRMEDVKMDSKTDASEDVKRDDSKGSGDDRTDDRNGYVNRDSTDDSKMEDRKDDGSHDGKLRSTRVGSRSRSFERVGREGSRIRDGAAGEVLDPSPANRNRDASRSLNRRRSRSRSLNRGRD